MIEKQKIQELIEEYIKGKELFLVSVKVSSANRIIVLADKKDGITIDECAAIHRHIENGLDRDVEDFELQVSSPGLDLPFSVIEQYLKNEGKKVEVVDNDGTKYTGKLKNITPGGFELETDIKIKGKAPELKDISFNFEQVKSTRIILIIK
ncbi:MAG TPA: ribosome assembly cofactor RimP [Bacteroidales bacterium]|nr:ribosome assembly cofactor RimP [Bacteroidales bacterium]